MGREITYSRVCFFMSYREACMDATENNQIPVLLTSDPNENRGGSETVRPDRNLEKWAIWEPTNSRHKPHARLIQREIRMPDGSVATAKVEVGFSNHGMLTTEDQKTCYALIKHWEELGRPTGEVCFSRQQIARILKKTWGQNVNKSLTASLMRLRFTPFRWERSYYESRSRETVELDDTFTILSELKMARRIKDAGASKMPSEPAIRENSWYAFNSRILANLLANYTKPVFLDTILGFRSDVAQILYTHLDLILADKTRYERRTKELFLDLGIDGTAYRYPSKRVQTLEPALKELEGCPLSTGVLKSITLERTKDESDFKIVACKSRQAYKPIQKIEALKPTERKSRHSAPGPNTNETELTLSFDGPAEAMPTASALLVSSEAAEQIRYFHQIFFRSGENIVPSPKELSQAQSHIARLGEEKARYLVTFAMREAKKTGFAIQTYGGILQYEGRAVAEFDENMQKRRQANVQKVREGHQKRFYEAFMDYMRETYAQLKKSPSQTFLAFLEEEEQQRRRFTTGPMANHSTMQRVAKDFDTEEVSLARFLEFFKTKKEDDKVFDFWTWDEKINPEGLAKLSDVR